jgi:two-component sensor histidine kinase
VLVFRDVTAEYKIQEELRESEATVRKKLTAILQPEGDIGLLNLADIIDYQALQTMMEDFYRLTNIGSAVLDISGKVLVAVGWQDICTKFHRVHPDTQKNCLESDVILSSGVPAGTFKTYRCKNNLWDMVTPIEVDGRHLGNIFFGQFFYEDEIPDRKLFCNMARRYEFDEKEYLAALDRVPRFSREKVNTAMTFYAKLAGMISSLSYSTIKLSRTLSQKDIANRQLAESEARYRSLYLSMNEGAALVLKEKELLLKEVHHRLKNYMNTISGLLTLQADSCKEPQVVEALRDAGGRMESMQVLYDKLYQTAGIDNISVRDYLSSLVDEIIGNFPNRHSVTIEKKIDDFILDAKRLQPLGIIINELLTNIMKHAFTGRVNGIIAVSASKSGNHVRLVIQDDGAGLSESINFENSTGFGFMLVRVLTQQLNGTIGIVREQGTKITLEFAI